MSQSSRAQRVHLPRLHFGQNVEGLPTAGTNRELGPSGGY